MSDVTSYTQAKIYYIYYDPVYSSFEEEAEVQFPLLQALRAPAISRAQSILQD